LSPGGFFLPVAICIQLYMLAIYVAFNFIELLQAYGQIWRPAQQVIRGKVNPWCFVFVVNTPNLPRTRMARICRAHAHVPELEDAVELVLICDHASVILVSRLPFKFNRVAWPRITPKKGTAITSPYERKSQPILVI